MGDPYYMGDADKNKRQYISEIKKLKRKIKKNFEDMDFKNATARDKMEDEINKITKECDSLVGILEDI